MFLAKMRETSGKAADTNFAIEQVKRIDKEVSKMFGVTPQTIVAYVREKNMPYHRIGKDGQYKFLQSEIHNWSKKQ